jgi:hypothetical protein
MKRNKTIEDYDGTTVPKTIGELIKLLEMTAKATKVNGLVIKGNKELEAQRASDVKELEDHLTEIMSEDNIKYIRQYTHMYH